MLSPSGGCGGKVIHCMRPAGFCVGFSVWLLHLKARACFLPVLCSSSRLVVIILITYWMHSTIKTLFNFQSWEIRSGFYSVGDSLLYLIKTF